MNKKKIAVLGTGMSGFGAAHRLAKEPVEVVLYDKAAFYGGQTVSYRSPSGFIFDKGPHVSFTKDERVQNILAEAVDGQFETVQYELENHWKGHRLPHPVQTHMHGLPVDVMAKVIEDFAKQSTIENPQIRNYEDWLVAAYGLAGFGYSVSATFLPVIVRTLGLPALVAESCWLVAGLAAIPASLLWGVIARRRGTEFALAAALATEAAGVALPLLLPNAFGALAGGALFGASFLAVVGLALAVAREAEPTRASRAMGLMTASFGLGQILAPALSSALIGSGAGFGLPLAIYLLRNYMAGLPREIMESARVDGATRWQTLLYVVLPSLRGAIITGALLTFARCIGEFGSTIMVSGNKAKTMTAPLYIYAKFNEAEVESATAIAAVLAVISFVVFSLILLTRNRLDK